jgi:hypothetical protein
MIYRSPFGNADKLPVSSVWEFVWSNPNKIPDEKDALIDGVTGERWRYVPIGPDQRVQIGDP